jgi:hypothetical protein
MPEERIDLLTPNPFLSSPGDLLAHYCAQQIALVPQFKTVFGQFIDGYLRMDYAIRNLPALRIYQMESYTMEADNWFVVGQLEADVILPASLRRELLHTVSDKITGALLQQFRRTPFFQTMKGLVPGLNWLGQSITVSKNRAFQFDEDTLVPMAVLSINFRVDLREWDLYLESQDRTVDDPFEVTLADLAVIGTTIAALLDDNKTDAGVDIQITQNV